MWMTGFRLKPTHGGKGMEAGGLVTMRTPPSGLQIMNDSILRREAAHLKDPEDEDIMTCFVGVERCSRHRRFQGSTNALPAGD